MPGVPFPYPNLTVFNGSGGMEFPMMVNDGSMGTNLEEAAEVTAHEIAHTYFPFYMGINERRYAWMDEGWASFLPNRIPFRKSAADAQTFTVQRTNAAYLSMYAGKEEEMPMMTPTNLLTGFSYGFATYFRPAVAYATLEEVLGRDKFKGVLQEYMRRWNGKHPMPYDFFYSFNAAAGEDLTWFWRPWFFEKGYPDLALRVTPEGNGTKVVVERKGSLPVPVHLQVTYADGTVETYAETARVWKDGAAEFAVEKTFTKPVRTVTLGDSQVPDANPRDNTYAR
jgi:aminopeptidase N